MEKVSAFKNMHSNCSIFIPTRNCHMLHACTLIQDIMCPDKSKSRICCILMIGRQTSQPISRQNIIYVILAAFVYNTCSESYWRRMNAIIGDINNVFIELYSSTVCNRLTYQILLHKGYPSYCLLYTSPSPRDS